MTPNRSDREEILHLRLREAAVLHQQVESLGARQVVARERLAAKRLEIEALRHPPASGGARALYLCGPINGCTDAECKDWRAFVTEAWTAEGGTCVDPMRRDYRGREAECMREIVELDKVDVEHCDALLVNHDRPSVGTSMEILYAWERGKLIVVVTPPAAVVSPWLRYHAHAVVHSFAEALAYLRSVGA